MASNIFAKLDESAPDRSALRLAAGHQSAAPDVQGDKAAPALAGFAPTPEFPEIEEALFAGVVLTRRAFHDGAPHCLRYP